MIVDAVVERFIEQTPVTVMARLALQRALDAAWVDALFEQHRQSQYIRELLFSTTVELMSLVAVGLRPSLHAATKACRDLPVSITALYDKINHTDPDLVRALVSGSARRLMPVLEAMHAKQPRLMSGYRVRILDGNHLPASEKRLKPLRDFRGAALPGQSLVVYDPDTGMIVDLVPCEDGHAQERSLMPTLLAAAQPGELWIADRNFSTNAILTGWHHRGCAFIVREHGKTPNPAILGALHKAGRIDTGVVFEQQVRIEDDMGDMLEMRRIELHLDEPTEDGETVIRLLTNLPKAWVKAEKVARLYRRRWSIETLFQRLESVLNSEIAGLGHPRAALLAFGVAALAFNVLAVLEAAVAIQHNLLQVGEMSLSAYYLATEIKAHYAGMLIAVAAVAWERYDAMTDQQLARELLQMAGRVDPVKLPSIRAGRRHRKRKATYQAKKLGGTSQLLVSCKMEVLFKDLERSAS